MPLRALLLAASLLGNAVLLAVWLARSPAPAPPPAPSTTLLSSSSTSRSLPTSAAALAPAALRDHFRALGLAPAAIDALVRARVYARHDARRRELLTAAAQSTPWWKSATPTDTGDPMRLLTPAQRKELYDLAADARAETLALVGPAALDPDGKIAARYSFLSPEKAVLLDALESDYRNFTAELRDETRGLRTPADREKEKLLATERQRDLAALLSPTERDALDERTSTTATRLANRMLTMQATEDEYRTIYALQKAFDEKFPAANAAGAGTAERPTSEQRAALEQQLRAALTPERYAVWETSSQVHASALARLALANNLPAQTVRDVSSLMLATANQSWRIGQDQSLTSAQRVAAVAQLAQDTRTQVSTQLGPDTATSYLRDVFWMDIMANGSAVRISGGGLSIRNLGTSSPGAPPPTALPRE